MFGGMEGIQTLAFAPVGSAMSQYRVTGGVVGAEVPIESNVVELTPWGDLYLGGCFLVFLFQVITSTKKNMKKVP